MKGVRVEERMEVEMQLEQVRNVEVDPYVSEHDKRDTLCLLVGTTTTSCNPVMSMSIN